MYLRLVSLPVVALLSAWLIFVIACFSNATYGIVPFLVLAGGNLLWGTIWLGRLIVSIVRQRRGSIPRQGLPYMLGRWSIEPVGLLLCSVLAFNGELYRLRFLISRPALDAYVADVIAGRAPPHRRDAARRSAGLFRISETQLQPSGIVLIITADGFLDDAGFAYSPISPPLLFEEGSYRHIVDRWYQWHRSW